MKPSTLLKSSIVYCLLPITSRSAELSLSEEFYEYFNVDKRGDQPTTDNRQPQPEVA